MTTAIKTARRRNPRGRGERLREEILEAATRIVAETGGASQLSLRGVAREVGIAATSVYLHFPDIDQLKAVLVDRGFAELNQARMAAMKGITDPAAALRARWGAYGQFAVDHPGIYRLMFGPHLPAAQAFDSPDSPGRQAFLAAVDAIRHCQEAGMASTDDDPFRLATLVWAAVHGTASLRLDRPNFPWPPLDEMVDDLIQRIIGVPRDGATALDVAMKP
jgi:AcrR family transcriptional regulator